MFSSNDSYLIIYFLRSLLARRCGRGRRGGPRAQAAQAPRRIGKGKSTGGGSRATPVPARQPIGARPAPSQPMTARHSNPRLGDSGNGMDVDTTRGCVRADRRQHSSLVGAATPRRHDRSLLDAALPPRPAPARPTAALQSLRRCRRWDAVEARFTQTLSAGAIMKHILE